MTLFQFKTLLQDNRDKGFRLVLPDQSAVPISFHITEVAFVQKTFIDCGGTMRELKTCQLQAWLGPDEDHRIAAGKMADVLNRAAHFLPPEDLELEIEYESAQISQYPVAGAEVSDQFVTLQLGAKHTACLAPELCIVPAPKSGAIALEMAPSNACGCGPSGCC
ncbi:hypothetical protein B1R32_102159 [Abditibacterium utsteinense]|uniref:Uncharacterized protein n=1 Tax=Abditibacterium utsteinense TaxID=1960156 RepID=A0A2S8SWG9_9BACT|nr:DUF6428 family protein [Abditibacterium utsteinense]PQV65151.1 hypothetical protein B1R32_102159 [Abditibacterium utsteinense]